MEKAARSVWTSILRIIVGPEAWVADGGETMAARLN
jgi:hypothetical protein